MISRRSFVRASSGLLAGVGALGGYTRYVEPQWLEVSRRRMTIRNLPTSLVGRTLVQVSDIHVSEEVPDDYVRSTFATVRALKPDIVAYTGDFTSRHDNEFEHAMAMYAELPRGVLGTVASLGNHDYGNAWLHPEHAARTAAILRAQGVTVLVNDITDVAGLHVVGMGDLWAYAFDPRTAFADLAPAAASLVLSHNPDTVDLPGWESYRGWILAGHTHGGQCKPPFLPPPMLPVKNRRYTSGEFALSNGRTMYINRGVGNVMSVRFNVRPEVTVFTLART